MSAAPESTPRSLGTLFAELRRRIRRYVLLEGVALFGAVIGLCFWTSLALDYLVEWPRFVRLLLLVTMLGLAGWTLFHSLIGRLLKDLRDRALALVLERRFPEIGDRLITTVELAGRTDVQAGSLPASMLDRTARELTDLIGRLNLSEVFNVKPLVRAALTAATLLVSMAGFAGLFGDVFAPWWRRNVLLAEETYPRSTKLEVFALAEPGERKLPLRFDAPYKHPRGADFTLLAEVQPGSEPPADVQIRHQLVDGAGGKRDYLTRFGESQFRYTLPGLNDSIRVWLRGGDYSSPAGWLVTVVDPPRLDRVTLQSLFPDYMGRNDRDDSTGASVRSPVVVNGTQITLPGGTDFIFEAQVNKPLVRATLRIEPFDLLVTRGSISVRSGGPSGPERQVTGEGMGLSADGRVLRVPFRLAAVVTEPAPIPAEGPLAAPLPLGHDSIVLITLEDEDAIISPQPIRISVAVQPDLPPELDLRLKGIGNSITRQARIPLVGKVLDDYGVKSLRFDLLVDDATQPTTRPFVKQPGDRPVTEFEVAEKFDVLPLDLKLGQRLALTPVAIDGDVLTGPHERAGEKLLFTIVSNDELLALIAGKELNLRRRFEQILDEVKSARKDLLVHRAKLDEAEKLSSTPADLPKQTELQQAVSAAVERVNSGLLKNENELISIQLSFGDLRDEIENNAVPDMQRLLARLDDGIIRPLATVNEKDLKRFRDDIGLLRLALADKQPALSSADAVLDDLAAIIERLEAILAQMEKLESLNEALQMLRDIIQLEKDLRGQVEKERKKSLLE